MVTEKKGRGIVILSLIYFALQCMLSLLSGSWGFVLSAFLYIGVIYGVYISINKQNRLAFIRLNISFLCVYTFYLLFIHYILIEDPFQNYYVNIDATGFLEEAEILANLEYSKIWNIVFTQFEYSGSPLFYAWVGTLQKIVNTTPFYSLLFQKLNVAFLGSFIPSIVYLFCKKVAVHRKAFKASIVYGLFSFIFFYSVGFMRDIHIALIYTVGLYVLTGKKFSLKNYIALSVLGLLAYYIRVENGLFFLAFLGVWLYKSGSNKKILISTVSIVGIFGAILALGGIETIYNMAFSTIEGYRERAVARADQDSLGVQLMNLPIPINYLGVTAFGQIGPFPFWVVFREGISIFKNFFYLPVAAAGLFWFLVWVRIVLNPQKALAFYRQYKWPVLVSLLYIFVVSMAQPGERRLMAVYPMIFMGYIYISHHVIKAKEIFYSLALYLFLIAVYWILKM